jgi:hypothetical protein
VWLPALRQLRQKSTQCGSGRHGKNAQHQGRIDNMLNRSKL